MFHFILKDLETTRGWGGQEDSISPYRARLGSTAETEGFVSPYPERFGYNTWEAGEEGGFTVP